MKSAFRFPDYAWLVESTGFGDFLDVVFTNDSGEVWLFNSDLEMIKQLIPFNALYLDRIAGRHRENISAVKILLRPDLVDDKIGLEASLKKIPGFANRLAQIGSSTYGKERLSTFYFGVVDEEMLHELSATLGAPEDTWILYARGADLDSGIAMYRPKHFPFQVPGDPNQIAVVWLLQHYPELNQRLKNLFVGQGMIDGYFKKYDIFKKVEITSTEPFDFRLIDLPKHVPPSPSHPHSVSLGDEVDVAIIAALPEEMAQLKEALLPEEPRRIPLHEEKYEYVMLDARTGPKRILLTTIIDQGTVPAAIRTWDVIHWWRPKHIILVGVAGGDPADTSQKLGDVVIGNLVVGYDRGKLVDGVFRSDISQYEADKTLLKAATDVKNSGRWPREIVGPPKPNMNVDKRTSGKWLLRLIGRSFPETPELESNIHDDLAIGSGNKLVLDEKFFKKLGDDLNRKIKAVEMEADGVCYACDIADMKVKALVIKGIMDKSDTKRDRLGTHRKQDWMRYAARAAAEFTIDVIKEL